MSALPLLVPALLSLAAALLVPVAVRGLYLVLSQSRLRVAGTGVHPPRTREEQTFFLHRITEAIGRPFAGALAGALGEARLVSVGRRIEAAGRPDGLSVERYLRRKVGEVALYGAVGVLMFAVGNPLIGLVVLAFTALTDLDLYVRTQERADKVQSQLPDFLDVLAVTVSAGLSFRSALSRVAESMPGVLADEFTLALRQMDLGTPRREAFEMLRRRNRNESLSKFVTAIQQAEELGAPLSDTLVNISQDMRRADAQYMRRKAQRLNPRVTMVTAVTLLPGLLLLIVGSMFLGTEVDLGVILGD
ncbi:type II secretion system F family protein [Nocardiopsis algeriensis]|uniref:Tight adherence protein C n=1 Tax=Nocardiopsis algeriensis TaxID=1478215 RepID=A0A841IPP6_9ACTN|nr:type II secretion system F family protein [Nocardiopsis algeriensis]MBB6120643.1 tight adherence protein C [Nocardiopsis algeriensis]